MKQVIYFGLSILFVVGSHGFAQTELIETHEFGETNVQWYIYPSGKTWEFEAENTMTVKTVAVKSVLASDGHTLHIQVSIKGDLVAEWDQYINDVHYQPYYHSKEISYSQSKGDKIVYKISGSASPAGGILGINYVKLTGVTQTGGEPDIAVSPDTLFFSVGTASSSQLKLLGPEQDLQPSISEKVFKVNPVAETIQFFSATSEQLASSDWDTLSNIFEPPYFYLEEQYHTRYEATKLIPERSSKLEALRFAFHNYQGSEQTKNCKFFVWDDGSSQPGTEIWSVEVPITIPAETSYWIKFDMSNADIHLNEFWVGHKENAEGAPTSLIDTVGTPGTDFYSSDGISWYGRDYDYLQQAIVSYESTDMDAVAHFTVKNTGTADLQVSDIYCGKDWVKSVSSDNFILESGTQKDVEIRCTAENLQDGRYTGMLAITSNDPDTPVYEVPLIFNINTTGIAPPQNLTASSTDNTVFLNWDPPANGNPDTYQIYRSQTSPVDAVSPNYLATVNGNTTTYHDTDSSLEQGQRLYYAVTAVYGGNESAPCQELMVIVEVAEESVPEIPTNFSLKQNYPNPFNPTTTIEFAIPTQSQVTLKLYDLLGREIATLLNKELVAGEYRVLFEAGGLSSGVYFYRINAEDFVDAKMLTLRK